MPARAVTSQIRPGNMDEWVALIRDSIVPSLREQKGFKGFVVLIDRNASETIGYSVWETDADLIASETSGGAAGESHVNSDHFKAAIALMPNLLASGPEVVHTEVPTDGWSRMTEIQVDDH